MIVKFMDYEQITPEIVDNLRKEFASSKQYVDGILAKRSAKEWAESCAGLCALHSALKEAKVDVGCNREIALRQARICKHRRAFQHFALLRKSGLRFL